MIAVRAIRAFVLILAIQSPEAWAQNSAKPVTPSAPSEGVGTAVKPLFLKDTVAVQVEFTMRNTNCQAINKTFYVCRVPYSVGLVVDETGQSKRFAPIFAIQASEGETWGSAEAVFRVVNVSATEITFYMGLQQGRPVDSRFVYHATYIVMGVLQ